MENSKKSLQLFLSSKKENVMGYGASTKGNVILNYCNITNKNISYICDANPIKEGKLPWKPYRNNFKKKNEKNETKYLIVLIWSFRTEVIKQEKQFIENGGKLIFLFQYFMSLIEKITKNI